MTVRNFWIDADIDGHKTHLSGGPQGAGGGFHCRFYWRDQGGICGPVAVWGTVDTDGALKLEAITQTGESIPLAEGRR